MPFGVKLEQRLAPRCVEDVYLAQLGCFAEGVGELQLIEHVVSIVAAENRNDSLLWNRRDDDRRQRTFARAALQRRDQKRQQRTKHAPTMTPHWQNPFQHSPFMGERPGRTS